MLELILIAAVIAADQITKYLSELYLSPLGTSYPLIPGVFQFTSVHNTGAAWGILRGFQVLFIPLTLLVCAFLAYAIIRYHKRLSVFSRITLSLLFAGAVGNVIDRILFTYVRDFMDFCLINFPVFNVADSALTIGCICLVVDALFVKKRSIFETVFDGRKNAGKPPENSEHA